MVQRPSRLKGTTSVLAAGAAWITLSAVSPIPAAAPAPGASGVATLSLATPTGRGSLPGAIEIREREITADLSGIPEGARIIRVVLRVDRDPPLNDGQTPPETIEIAPADRPEERLALRAPRFRDFDATEAARRALAAREPLVLQVLRLSGWRPGGTRLDVTAAGLPFRAIERITDLRASHIDGQTFLTWREPYPLLTKADATIADLRAARTASDREREIRYRIYRSDRPITADSIADAERIDEVGGFTAWNGEYYGVDPKPEAPAFRWVVREGEGPVPPGTGIYVHRPARAASSFFAVFAVVDGEEDLAPVPGENVAGPIDERIGYGTAVLQRTVKPEGEFQYVKGATIHYFARWESPPASNLPSRPFDYLVAVPAKVVRPSPVCIALHCWGGSLNGGYGWWYGASEGALLIATNQVPYDWWASYHECFGTLRSFRDGVARNYSPERLWRFLDWVATRWPIDRGRIIVCGNSMGGAGVSHWIRYGDRVTLGISWVGVHIPLLSPQFRGSYERVVGRADDGTVHESGEKIFDFLDGARWLRTHPAAETPLLTFANGKNDGAIGWKQAVDFVRALRDTKRPFIFRWGMGGHGERAYVPTPDGGGDNARPIIGVRSDQSMPAFTNCSLDDDPGDGDPQRGVPTGQMNLYLRWDPASIADEPAGYSIRIHLIGGAPEDDATTDITPRRAQAFRLAPGRRFTWTSALDAGEIIGRGEGTADANGLATAAAVPVRKAGVVVRFEASDPAPGSVFLEDEPIRLRIGSAPDADLAYEVIDYDGKTCARGTVPRGAAEIEFPSPGRGWFEIDIAGRGRRAFGVIADRPDVAPPGGPIAVDGATAWLSKPEEWPAIARMLRRAGIGWIRERLSFSQVAPARGSYAWGRYEALAREMSAQGIRIYQIFHDTPPWTHPGRRNTRNPDDLRDVYAFAKAAAEHFRGRILAWEPWNEPDIFFWPDLGDAYAGVQKAAYLGFKAADPELPILLASLCRGRCAFDDNIFESGIADYYDIFNYHTYADPERYPPGAAAYRALTKEYGTAGRPVWLTECGIRLESKDGVLSRDSERTQAEFVPKSIAMSLATGTDRHFFFVLPHYVEGKIQFGAMREGLTPRPSFVAIAAAVEILGEARYRGRLAGAPPGAHVHVFDRGGSLVAVAWSGAGADLECPVRGDEATIADLLGRRSPVEASNGKARVRLSRSPIYVLDIEPSAKLEGPPHEPGKLPRNHPSPIVIAGRAEGLALQKDKNAYTVAGEPFDLRVDAYALREGKGAKGSIRIEVPEGWRADPDAAEVSLEPMGRESLRIRVTPGAATKDRQRIRVTGSFEGESPAPSVSHFLWKDGA